MTKTPANISIPNWRQHFVICFSCNKEIKDKELIAIANLGQVFNTYDTSGCNFGDRLTIGHTRKHAYYFHKDCFISSSCKNDELAKKLQSSEMTKEDWNYLNKLAGLGEIKNEDEL